MGREISGFGVSVLLPCLGNLGIVIYFLWPVPPVLRRVLGIYHWVFFCLFVIQLLSRVRLFVTPRTIASWALLSFTISRGLLKLMSTELVMPSNHLTLCHALLLLPSIFPSIRVFFNELAFCIRWPKN